MSREDAGLASSWSHFLASRSFIEICESSTCWNSPENAIKTLGSSIRANVLIVCIKNKHIQLHIFSSSSSCIGARTSFFPPWPGMTFFLRPLSFLSGSCFFPLQTICWDEAHGSHMTLLAAAFKKKSCVQSVVFPSVPIQSWESIDFFLSLVGLKKNGGESQVTGLNGFVYGTDHNSRSDQSAFPIELGGGGYW